MQSEKVSLYRIVLNKDEVYMGFCRKIHRVLHRKL